MYEKRPRLQTFDYVSCYRYFLTFCSCNRRQVFTNPTVVSLVREQILESGRARSFAILAYVFMPDHLHLLIEGKSEQADMRSFAELTKQKSGYVYSKSHHQRLWQPSYYDRVLRDDDATWDVIRYIVDNPVRANLVGDFRMFPFLGSGVMTREQLVAELAARGGGEWRPERKRRPRP